MSYVKSYRKIPNQWNHKIFKLGNVSGKQIEEEERRSSKKEQESQLKNLFSDVLAKKLFQITIPEWLFFISETNVF